MGITNILLVIANFLLVVATCLLYKVTKRYADATEQIYRATERYANATDSMKEIADRQTKIMEDQKELSRRIDESNKAMIMWREHDTLVSYGYLKTFWDELNKLYEYFCKVKSVSMLPKSLSEVIQKEGFLPEVSTLEVKHLSQLVVDYQNTWDKLVLWNFVKFVYSEGQEVDSTHDGMGSMSERDAFRNAQYLLDTPLNTLSDFWYKWCSLFDVSKYIEPYLQELVVLTWLELAIVWHGKSSGMLGKDALLMLTKAGWESFKRSSDHSKMSQCHQNN